MESRSNMNVRNSSADLEEFRLRFNQLKAARDAASTSNTDPDIDMTLPPDTMRQWKRTRLIGIGAVSEYAKRIKHDRTVRTAGVGDVATVGPSAIAPPVHAPSIVHDNMPKSDAKRAAPIVRGLGSLLRGLWHDITTSDEAVGGYDDLPSIDEIRHDMESDGIDMPMADEVHSDMHARARASATAAGSVTDLPRPDSLKRSRSNTPELTNVSTHVDLLGEPDESNEDELPSVSTVTLESVLEHALANNIPVGYNPPYAQLGERYIDQAVLDDFLPQFDYSRCLTVKQVLTLYATGHAPLNDSVCVGSMALVSYAGMVPNSTAQNGVRYALSSVIPEGSCLSRIEYSPSTEYTKPTHLNIYHCKGSRAPTGGVDPGCAKHKVFEGACHCCRLVYSPDYDFIHLCSKNWRANIIDLERVRRYIITGDSSRTTINYVKGFYMTVLCGGVPVDYIQSTSRIMLLGFIENYYKCPPIQHTYATSEGALAEPPVFFVDSFAYTPILTEVWTDYTLEPD